MELPEKICNCDIAMLATQAMRFCEELANCASASRDQFSQHDLIRARDALAFFQSRFDVFSGDPELDLPKYHPNKTVIKAFPVLPEYQNADITGLVNMWAALTFEMCKSDSAERATGFSTADSGRINAVLDKIGRMLDTFEGDPEVDLPDATDVEPGA